MCVRVVKGGGSRPWKLISKLTGRVVGTSETKAKAEAAVRARGVVAGRKGVR